MIGTNGNTLLLTLASRYEYVRDVVRRYHRRQNIDGENGKWNQIILRILRLRNVFAAGVTRAKHASTLMFPVKVHCIKE